MHVLIVRVLCDGGKIFATVGCHPTFPLMVWDSRKDNRPVHTLSYGFLDENAPSYLSVASQPFNPEVGRERVGGGGGGH